MKRNILTNLSLVLAVLFLVAACKSKSDKPEVTGDPFKLQFAPEVGVNYVTDMDMKMDIEVEMMGQKMDMPMTMSMQMTQIAQEPNGDEFTFLTTYNKMKMKMSAQGMNIDFDSENPQPDENPMTQEMTRALGAMIGQTVEMIYKKDGTVKEIRGMDRIFNEMGLDQAQLEQLGGMNNFGNNMQGMMPAFPSEEIRIGEEWTNETTTNVNNMPMEAKNTFTVMDRKDGKVTLRLNSDVTVNFDDLKETNAQMAMIDKMEMDGIQEGTMIIDEKTGMLIEADMTQDFELEMEAMGMSMPMTISSTIKMNCTK